MNKVCCVGAVMAVLTANSAFAQRMPPRVYISDRAAARLLEQATWGPTPTGIELVKSVGIEKWIQMQFAAMPSDLPDQPILTADGKNNGNTGPVERAFFQIATTGQDQLRQRVAFILSQIWVVSRLGVTPAYAFPPYWRVFRDHAFDNYRDIIRAVTINPAMGRYLNMANNDKGNPAKGITANENYAREVMQLFALGLVKLNQDGSPVIDQNGAPAPTYDQAIVENLAKVFTGWTYPTAPGATARAHNPAYYYGEMFPVESNHDTGPKTLFNGFQVPPGQSSRADLESALDALMAQDTMAPFISKQLIEHLVTSNPSPDYISRVAAAFLDNGSGVRGDMKSVITAILMDPEARADDDPSAPVNPRFGHLREPILFLTGLLRGLNANVSDTSTAYTWTVKMGQELFAASSVFSYFSPQSRTQGGLLGPEFQIYSTATSAARANTVNAALYSQLDKGTTVDLSPFMRWSGNFATLLDRIDCVFMHRSMSSSLKQAALSAAQAASTPEKAVQAALYVVLSSAEYNVVH
jgi:uncharacterized protein (DUF1800 family)